MTSSLPRYQNLGFPSVLLIHLFDFRFLILWFMIHVLTLAWLCS